MALYGGRGPSEFRNEGGLQGKAQEIERSARKRESGEAVEELREHGKLKRPWYQRLFRRTR
jgi:hypothetical protein